jgi:3-phosphoshikimate 1-carboxyvinyltransferase
MSLTHNTENKLSPRFHFSGMIPVSKSLMNRALIIQSYADKDTKSASKMTVVGETDAEDVLAMTDGLKKLAGVALANPSADSRSQSDTAIDCGHAGTVLRFLALRASRIPGEHILTGSERLFARPQQELLPILAQLGVNAELDTANCLLKIHSESWRLMVDGLHINTERSSQFASAVLLNSWELPSPIHFTFSRKFVSEAYWQMTVKLVREWGMNVETRGSEIFIPARAKVKAGIYHCESDLSSAFAIASCAVIAGHAEIKKFPINSLQPDKVFVRILKNMGAKIDIKNDTLVVDQTLFLNGINENIENSPDLFPVLAVLCGLARTKSTISGIGHLKYKESHRLEKTKALLEYMGAEVQIHPEQNEVVIDPVSVNVEKKPLVFDPDQDHRMAMAAELLRLKGYPIEILSLDVVKKSFPPFFRITRGEGNL